MVAGDIMNRKVVTVARNTSLAVAARLMLDHGITGQ